ncbi:large ribosomal subunit protein bL21m-like [Bidens hawaiensis]|uniref:large ribosomal subunit protein bL21m-like n=1 Tax=Bidens hawaiensis TaxID=980011 RepID=UPI00404A1C65
MANRRCIQTLTHQLYKSKLYTNPSSLHHLRTLSQIPNLPLKPFQSHRYTLSNPDFNYPLTNFTTHRYYSSDRHNSSEEDDSEFDENEEEDDEMETSSAGKKEYSPEEKESEAAAIGYKVIGQLERSDRVFKDYEPVFAVIQSGSHQCKVSNGDCIYTEKLKFCEVNDKIIINKVLMLGSKTQTMIGRPVLPEAAVHAVVEEHALDAKVIIFKKKRRKNYRRTKGHRQELTKLRITDIQGIEKPEMPTPTKKVEKAAVAA